MNRAIRVLHLEDDPDYCDFVQALLQTEDIEAQIFVASNQSDFETALAKEELDLIIADFLLPGYDGLQALQSARAKRPQVPFLLVSGTIGEQAAIESLKAGATDYVLKIWPDRLVPAIRRALKESQESRERRRLETEFLRRERYYRTLTQNALDVLTTMDAEGVLLYMSPSVERVLGYDSKTLVGRKAFDLVHPDDLPVAMRRFEEGLADPQLLVRMDLRVRHQDGSWRYLEAIGQNRLQDPDMCSVVVTLRDVTERKQAEANLQESEHQYRLIFDSNPMPMWVFDEETLQFLEVNDAAVQHYGYSREEFLGMSLKDLRVSDEPPVLMEYMHKLLPPQPPRTVTLAGTWKHRRKDGSLIDVELKWSPISFKGRIASLAMANDITERRRIEERDDALSKLGQSLSSATSPSEAAQIIRAVADELFHWDAFTLDLYSAEDDQIHTLLNVDTDKDGTRTVLVPEPRPTEPSRMARRIIEHGAELLLRREPVEMSGESVPIGDVTRPSASLMLAPIRNRTKVIGVLSIQSYSPNAYDNQDLGTLQTLADHCGGALERIRAEQALHESEQRFRELFENSPDAIFVEDLEGMVLDVNPAACRLHGLGREQLIGMNFSSLVPPQHVEEARQEFQALVEEGVGQIEGASLTAQGRSIPVEVRASRIEYAGRPSVLLHVRDVTERQQAEAALRSSEMLFHSVWENSVDGMRLTDHDGQIVAVNNAYCLLVGMERGELEGKPFTIVYAESEEPGETLAQYRQEFGNRIVRQQDEQKLKLRDGAIVTFEQTSSFVEVRGKDPLMLSLFRDIAARKRLEDQLRQSQKMEAIGQLAGGVAHDFNNLLTVIHGHACLLTGGNLNGTAAKSAQQISQAAERAAGLTRQLLTFSRRQMMQPRLLDLNEVVGNMTNMLGRILGEDIALQLNYSPLPALVNADAGMLEQVLLNCAVNSRDAMPRGGVLKLRIHLRDLSASELPEDAEAQPGRFVCLSVIDTGCGIAPENLRRIFEPFFTTKEVGKGTGLGLATVYGIVKQHRGWVDVESTVGQGTIFKVYLPASENLPSLPPPRVSEPAIRGGTETILVVEDEGPVRELVCQVLERHGYRIYQAESGAEALAVWTEKGSDIDLLLTDLVMPDRINGRELAQKLWSERPGLKVIFTSGYSADVVGPDFVLKSGLNFLQKPFQPQNLAATVRHCLDCVN